jgi:hypothetical protein
MAQDGRERKAYALACQLDTEGKYGEADQALCAGGIAEDVVTSRRVHLEWRIANGYSVTGDTLTKVKPAEDSQ